MSFSAWGRPIPAEHPPTENFHEVKFLMAEFLGRSGSLRSEPVTIVPEMYSKLNSFLMGAQAVAGDEYKKDIEAFQLWIEENCANGFEFWIGDEGDN
jgi:hypothetical protein